MSNKVKKPKKKKRSQPSESLPESLPNSLPEESSAAATATAAAVDDESSDKKKIKKSDKKKKKKKTASSAGDVAAGANGANAGAAAVVGGAANGEGTEVRVEGMDVTPLRDFASASFPSEVMQYVTLRGWKEPTPIQAHCWPVLNAGRDVIGIAETGSGKTLAFSLPGMSRIFKRSKV